MKDGMESGGALEWIIGWSLRNRVLVILLTVLGIAWGAWSLYQTPVDALPDLSDAQVIVYASIPASPHASSRTR